MSTPANAVPGAPAAAPVPNDAWYLHGQGRRFGPLTEEDMRGYFRAGMVKGNDSIGVPGQVGTVSAQQAAELLGMPAPAAVVAPVVAPAPTSIRVTETGTHTSGVLVGLGLFVAVVGLAYLILHVPASEQLATEAAQAQAAPPPAATAAPAPVASSAAEWKPGSSTSLLGSALSQEPDTSAASPGDNATDTNLALQSVPTDKPKAASDEWWDQARQLWGNWSALRAHAEKWTMAEPRRDLAWWYLGVAYHYLGDYNAAIVAYQQGLAVNPSHFKLRWALSNAYAAQNRHRESAEILQVLIREQPGDANLWNDLGWAWAQLGEYDESVAALEKAVQLDPKDRQAWENLAWTYAKFGNPDKSKDATARGNASLGF